MTKERSIDNYLKPPEFEERCDKFVQKVDEGIVPKYPDLEINSVNETTYVPLNDPKIQKIIEDKLYANLSEEDIQRIRNLELKMARHQEFLSTVENCALVDVSGPEGLKAIPDINKAIKDVFDLAKEYRGKYEPNKANGKVLPIIDTEDPNLPSAHLRFVFTD